jgi:hypothetical protein
LHTIARGHTDTYVFAGDLIPGDAWVHLPITMGYDRFPEQVIDEKESFYRSALAENWTLFFTHDPKYAAATIQFDGAKKRYSSSKRSEELSNVSF